MPQDQLFKELLRSFFQEFLELFYPDVAARLDFARVTFLSDNRDDLPKVTIPSLLLQCSDDAIAPIAVGEYVHAQIPESRLVVLNATGHCPNLSAPEETIAAMKAFLDA